GHHRDRDRLDDPLDHVGVAHPAHPALRPDVGGHPLQRHDGDRTGVLGDLGLLGGDDVHDHPALEHLRHAALDAVGAGGGGLFVHGGSSGVGGGGGSSVEPFGRALTPVSMAKTAGARSSKSTVRGSGALPASANHRVRRRLRSARVAWTWSLWNRRASSTLRLAAASSASRARAPSSCRSRASSAAVSGSSGNTDRRIWERWDCASGARSGCSPSWRAVAAASTSSSELAGSSNPTAPTSSASAARCCNWATNDALARSSRWWRRSSR